MNELIRRGLHISLVWLFSVGLIRGETVILHLKNGDRLTGTLVSEDTNRVVIGTPWQNELAVPKTEISKRENVAATPGPTAPVAAPAPVVAAKPAAPPVAPPPPKHWNADLQFGLDIQESTKSRTLYYTRDKLSYARPLWQQQIPFRSTIDYNYSYGKTEGIRSTDRMDGSSKSDLDVKKSLFVYNLGGAGYDKIRRIDLQYEEGPGVGYHLIARTNFVLNTEVGMNYQVQQFSDGNESKNVYFRLAEDLNWKINKKTDLVQKVEFFPQADTFSKFRFRFDSTLRYALLQNLSINLTVIDLYDSKPALNTNPNDLQIRSSIGVRF